MFRAVVLGATLLLASLGAVGQNTSSPSAGRNPSTQSTAPAQNATQPAAPTPGARDSAGQSATNTAPSKGIQNSAQDQDPRTASSAELPQTSTILPLLGLLGLGSLVAGLFARR